MEHSIDIDKISNSVEDELDKLKYISEECCIYRVPKYLRLLNQNAYRPQLISIGPLYYGKDELKAMEEDKKRYLKDFLQLSRQASMSVKDYVNIIMEKEKKLRNFYAEIIELPSKEFVKMILFDAAFIIMVLLKNVFILGGLVSRDADLLFKKSEMMLKIRYDLMLLENQIPFFILEDLFNSSQIQNNVIEESYDLSDMPEFQGGFTMIGLTNCFFQVWISTNISSFKKQHLFQVNHLLDFFRVLYSPSEWNPQRMELKTLYLPSVKELHQAGVKFKPGSKDNIFDIKFKDGILEIPPITLADSTELLFRNLQAYERCHYSTNFFRDYILIMYQLVSSPKDAEFLIKKGIIENWMSGGDEKVPALFDSLGMNIVMPNDFPYCTLIEDLNNYYAACWPRWNAAWKQKYFTTPWAIFSVIAAAFLLVLTIVQTVCSILQLVIIN